MLLQDLKQLYYLELDLSTLLLQVHPVFIGLQEVVEVEVEVAAEVEVVVLLMLVKMQVQI